MMKIKFAAALLLAAQAAWSLRVPAGAREARLVMPDGAAVLAELALTPEQQARGLMHRTELPVGRGMLFVFSGTGTRQFWMKNTLIDLDMVFLSSDLKVLRVFHRVPRSSPGLPDGEVARVSGEAALVLEVPAGYARAHRLRPGVKLGITFPSRDKQKDAVK